MPLLSSRPLSLTKRIKKIQRVLPHMPIKDKQSQAWGKRHETTEIVIWKAKWLLKRVFLKNQHQMALPAHINLLTSYPNQIASLSINGKKEGCSIKLLIRFSKPSIFLQTIWHNDNSTKSKAPFKILMQVLENGSGGVYSRAGGVILIIGKRIEFAHFIVNCNY